MHKHSRLPPISTSITSPSLQETLNTRNISTKPDRFKKQYVINNPCHVSYPGQYPKARYNTENLSEIDVSKAIACFKKQKKIEDVNRKMVKARNDRRSRFKDWTGHHLRYFDPLTSNYMRNYLMNHKKQSEYSSDRKFYQTMITERIMELLRGSNQAKSSQLSKHIDQLVTKIMAQDEKQTIQQKDPDLTYIINAIKSSRSHPLSSSSASGESLSSAHPSVQNGKGSSRSLSSP